jgi:hypothetical protein
MNAHAIELFDGSSDPSDPLAPHLGNLCGSDRCNRERPVRHLPVGVEEVP